MLHRWTPQLPGSHERYICSHCKMIAVRSGTGWKYESEVIRNGKSVGILFHNQPGECPGESDERAGDSSDRG